MSHTTLPGNLTAQRVAALCQAIRAADAGATQAREELARCQEEFRGILLDKTRSYRQRIEYLSPDHATLNELNSFATQIPTADFDGLIAIEKALRPINGIRIALERADATAQATPAAQQAAGTQPQAQQQPPTQPGQAAGGAGAAAQQPPTPQPAQPTPTPAQPAPQAAPAAAATGTGGTTAAATPATVPPGGGTPAPYSAAWFSDWVRAGSSAALRVLGILLLVMLLIYGGLWLFSPKAAAEKKDPQAEQKDKGPPTQAQLAGGDEKNPIKHLYVEELTVKKAIKVGKDTWLVEEGSEQKALIAELIKQGSSPVPPKAEIKGGGDKPKTPDGGKPPPPGPTPAPPAKDVATSKDIKRLEKAIKELAVAREKDRTDLEALLKKHADELTAQFKKELDEVKKIGLELKVKVEKWEEVTKIPKVPAFSGVVPASALVAALQKYEPDTEFLYAQTLATKQKMHKLYALGTSGSTYWTKQLYEKHFQYQMKQFEFFLLVLEQQKLKYTEYKMMAMAEPGKLLYVPPIYTTIPPPGPIQVPTLHVGGVYVYLYQPPVL